MSFQCFIPGGPVIGAEPFQQVDHNRWVVNLSAPTPINELACFITSPLAPGQALGCHIASAPFETFHYLGRSPQISRLCLQDALRVERRRLRPHSGTVWRGHGAGDFAAQTPAEKVSAEVLEAGRRIGHDLYSYIASFATAVSVAGESKIQLPANICEKWLSRFNDKCGRDGLDWLSSVV